MPASNPGRNTSQSVRRAKPKPTAPPRQADTGDKARTRPAPKQPKTVFKTPATTRPFARQQQQAQTEVRIARRALPAPALPAPPIVGGKTGSSGGPQMSRAEVETFLRSESKTAAHARNQIVGGIRKQIGNVHGQERVDAIGRILDEIATDPRLEPTRRAIRHYTAIEARTARPQTTATAKPGPGDKKVGVGFATVNLTAATRLGEKLTPGLQQGDAAGKFARNALKDVAHLPLMGPQTIYEVGRAAADLTQGDTERAKKLAQGLLDGVYGHLVRGDVDGAVEYFREHPVFAALEVRGGKGVAGRGLGAAMRSGKLGDRAQQAASTQRADINLSGEGARVADRQHYSPDVFTKLFQVAVEKKRGEGKTVMRDHRLRRRADFESDTAAGTSRAVRADEASQAKDARPKGPLDAVVGLAVQGVIRPASLEADLRKELARLDNAHATAEFSTGAQKRQNRTTADAIRKVLDSPQAMARIGEVAQSGRANVRAINELEGRARDLEAITPERADRAALFPAAQAHLGAEYSDAPFRAAREAEVAAGRDLRSERTRLSQTVAQAREYEQRAQAQVKTLAAKHKIERGKEGHNQQIAVYRVGGQRFNTRAEAAAHIRELEGRYGVLDFKAERSEAPPSTVPAGHVRLYRGQGVARWKNDGEDWADAPLDGEYTAGGWFTDNAERAAHYAKGGRGFVSYVDVPESVARATHHSDPKTGATFVLPEEWWSRAREVEPGSIVRTIREYAERDRNRHKAYELAVRRWEAKKALGEKVGPRPEPRSKPKVEIERLATTASEAKRVGELSRARRAASAVTQRRREAEASLRALNRRGKDAVPARAAFEAARGQRKAAQRGGTQSLNVGGARVTNETIRDAVGEDVAYLPHHTRDRGARAYYQTAFAGRKNLDASKKRTGSAFEKGAVDVSYDAVAEHRIRMRGVVNRIAEHDKIIHSIAIKGPGGRMMTWDQAEKIAKNAGDKGAKLVPYRAVPGSYDKARIAQIADSQAAAEMPNLGEMIGHEFAERLKAPSEGDKTAQNVVLIPEQIANQLKEQQKTSSSAGAAGNVAADTFRRVVLPFSTKWLAGNVIEAGVRLTAVGAGPNAWRIGKNLLTELDKLDREQAIRVRSALTGGLLFGNRGLTVKRVSEHFEGTSLAKPAAAVGVAARMPVVKHLGSLMRTYTDAVFTFNRMIESNAQIAALGKHAKRDMQEMTGSWAKATRAQEKALQDVAKGLMDSKNVHDAARYIDQTLGQYSRFSPPMRRFIQQAAPFLPWYLNAARWVAWTLPAKHPIKTGIYALVAANLQEDFDAQHEGLPPGDLRGEIVLDDGTVLPAGRYTPFSLFGTIAGGGDEQLTALIDPLFPQFKSAGLAAFGLNFSGRPAKIDPRDRGPDGRGVPGAVRVSMAFNSLLEAFVPALGIGKRVREGGSTGYDNSTIASPKVKPGTDVPGGAANRILNPFRPVSGIKGGTRGAAKPTATATPSAAPSAPLSVEDELLQNLDSQYDAAQGQQQLEDELLENLYGGG